MSDQANFDLESPIPLQHHQRQLFSDIEAFKAANPSAYFEDFIRWYSPKDWDSENQSLSLRMQDDSNLWKQLWHAGQPISASEQRMFIFGTGEIDKLIHSLESASTIEIAEFCSSYLKDVYLAQFDKISACLDLDSNDPVKLSKNYFISLEVKSFMLTLLILLAAWNIK